MSIKTYILYFISPHDWWTLSRFPNLSFLTQYYSHSLLFLSQMSHQLRFYSLTVWTLLRLISSVFWHLRRVKFTCHTQTGITCLFWNHGRFHFIPPSKTSKLNGKTNCENKAILQQNKLLLFLPPLIKHLYFVFHPLKWKSALTAATSLETYLEGA